MAFVSSLCQTKTKGMPSAVHKGLMAGSVIKICAVFQTKKKKKRKKKKVKPY